MAEFLAEETYGTLVAVVGVVEEGQAAEAAHVAVGSSGIVWGAFHGIADFRFPISVFRSFKCFSWSSFFAVTRHAVSRYLDEEVCLLVEADEIAALPLAQHHVGCILCLLLLGIGLVHVIASE